MPFSKKFPLEELKEAVKYWYDKTKKIITYIYNLKGINDDDEHIDVFLLSFAKSLL